MVAARGADGDAQLVPRVPLGRPAAGGHGADPGLGAGGVPESADPDAGRVGNARSGAAADPARRARTAGRGSDLRALARRRPFRALGSPGAGGPGAWALPRARTRRYSARPMNRP